MPIDTDVGEICRDETVGVAGGGCECVPAAPQPQFSDASNRTPMQVTIFLIESPVCCDAGYPSASSHTVEDRHRTPANLSQ
jgi:hypothetical protein